MHKKLDELTTYKVKAAAAELMVAETIYQAAEQAWNNARAARAQVWAQAGLLPSEGVFMTPGPGFGTVMNQDGTPVEMPAPTPTPAPEPPTLGG